MKKYIFLQKYMEVEKNLEDASFLDIIEWKDSKDAFKNLRKKYDYLNHSWDPELYICLELATWKPEYLTISEDELD